jgi:mRNA-degrading endonuclease toxin of MazEF toxin-antitoxin module
MLEVRQQSSYTSGYLFERLLDRRGQVVVVNVPFTGQTGSKPRPALVVSVEAFHQKLPDVIVCPISSQPRYFRKPGPGDRPLKHWKAVGLRYASTTRISNILAVEKKLIMRVLGTLHREDLVRVEQALREAFL